MIAEQKLWHHRVRLAKTRRNIYVFCEERSSFMLTSGQGQVTAGQVYLDTVDLDLWWSCCISFDLAAHFEDIGAFSDALAQFGQELLTKN